MSLSGSINFLAVCSIIPKHTHCGKERVLCFPVLRHREFSTQSVKCAGFTAHWEVCTATHISRNDWLMLEFDSFLMKMVKSEIKEGLTVFFQAE